MTSLQVGFYAYSCAFGSSFGAVLIYAVSGILKCPPKTSCLILGTLDLMREYSLIMLCVEGNFADMIRVTNELNVNQP